MKKLLALLAAFALVLSLSGCEEKEKTAGEQLDEAISQTKEASKNALDDMKKALDDN